VSFALSDNADAPPPCFVLGVRKSGSSILNSMVIALARRQNLPFVDIAGQFFKAGHRVDAWQRDPGLATLVRGGNVYGGFRNAPLGLKDCAAYTTAPKVLLVRDPRDALVSEYFSNAYSHSMPAAAGKGLESMQQIRQVALSSSVEAYVLDRAELMARTMMEYAPLADDPATRVFRYEDVILDKRRLMADISHHFKWPVDDNHLGLVLKWADVVPDGERPTEFVRRVVPGDHRNKLSPEAIRRLDLLLEAPMKTFGYTA
jgi:hypothetical protein